MLLHLLAAGTRLPQWTQLAYAEYAERLQGPYRLQLQEIALGARGRLPVARAVAEEGARMLAHLEVLASQAQRPYVVALQVGGKAFTSEQLAEFLGQRARDGRSVAFCIGGPDGLAMEVDRRADLRWSLSALTLPHALARVVVAEALYRAVCILRHHPYHRA